MDYLFKKNVKELKDISSFIRLTFRKYPLPKSKKALIFIKPNFNSDMIALTGNTTDLRLLVSLVKELKRRGYNNIIVGDGTSSGFINTNINVLERLGVYKLGELLNFKVIDLNKAPYRKIKINNHTLKLARVCFKADYFINLPKVKTHAEAGFSCCIKNMMGCIVGLDKQIMHNNLNDYLIKLNKVLRPSLNIVDAIISMEGNGPSDGNPKATNMLFAGKDSFALDYIITKFFGISTPHYLSDIKLDKEILPITIFKEPSPSLLYKLINGSLRPLFVKIRYSPLFFKLLSSEKLGKFLKLIGLRQDYFIKKEKDIKLISSLKQSKKIVVCPLGYTYNDVNKCNIKCMYCFFSDKNINIEGELGYLRYQLKKYGKNKNDK